MAFNLFRYVQRTFFTQSASANNVYVPGTTNAMNSIQGGALIYAAAPAVISRQTNFEPNLGAINTPALGNQIPQQVVTQGLINNAPGSNF